MPVIDRPAITWPVNQWAAYKSQDKLVDPVSVQLYSAIDTAVDISFRTSAFLSSETQFTLLRSQLHYLRQHDGPDVLTPAARMSESILNQCRLHSLTPSTLVDLRDEPGIGLTFYSGARRAELEILDDGGAYLTMYDRQGPIHVSEPDLRDSDSMIVRIGQFINA